jgi:predicted nucleic acid-binding protein
VAALTGGLTLDTGALIAAEKGAEGFWALLKSAIDRRALITVPAPVLAQAWRKNNPVIARVLKACRVSALDEVTAKRVGNLLADSRTADVVDAAVVVGAVERGDTVATSDPDDIGRLAVAAGAQLRILRV